MAEAAGGTTGPKRKITFNPKTRTRGFNFRAPTFESAMPNSNVEDSLGPESRGFFGMSTKIAAGNERLNPMYSSEINLGGSHYRQGVARSQQSFHAGENVPPHYVHTSVLGDRIKFLESVIDQQTHYLNAIGRGNANMYYSQNIIKSQPPQKIAAELSRAHEELAGLLYAAPIASHEYGKMLAQEVAEVKPEGAYYAPSAGGVPGVVLPTLASPSMNTSEGGRRKVSKRSTRRRRATRRRRS